ncbi:flagellar basal body-associated FliL family protein [Granulosicoccus sp.]|nr:flagellar basal body-associated FliL family protein [Granulosicoccus sp.]
MKQKIILGVLGFVGLSLIVGGSVGASLYFTGAFNDEPAAAAAMPVAEPLPENTYYYNVQPEFVVNFQGNSRVKFLMIEMAVATHDEEVVPILEEHDPEVRNALLDLLSEQKPEALKTADGKQALRDDAVVLVDEIVGRYYRTERVHDVFITRLVMQ